MQKPPGAFGMLVQRLSYLISEEAISRCELASYVERMQSKENLLSQNFKPHYGYPALMSRGRFVFLFFARFIILKDNSERDIVRIRSYTVSEIIIFKLSYIISKQYKIKKRNTNIFATYNLKSMAYLDGWGHYFMEIQEV